MKKTVFQIMTGTMMLAGILFTSNSCKNLCKDVECQNGGTCVEDDGSCDCSGTGYEGTNCETEERAKFLGSWSVTDNCSSSGSASYTSTISKSSTGITKVLISNFWDAFANNVEGTISGSDIDVSLQEPDGDGWTVSGSGTISGTQISWSYTVADPTGQADNCTATWDAQ
ncbi:MAG: calcium-binding EGF-like domain-containing protein [Flavobacteriales bacterium]